MDKGKTLSFFVATIYWVRNFFVAVNQADLEAIKQAIIGAINSAAGTAGTGATVGDPAEIARLEAYVQTLNRANAALDRQEQRAQS